MEYKIIKNLASFPDGGEWTKELNIISWNGRLPKYDIRNGVLITQKCQKESR